MSMTEHSSEPMTASADEVVEGRFRTRVQENWTRMIAVVSIVVIALGGINDSWDAIEKMTNFTLSQFTDIPSDNNLNRIYIRASGEVLEETFGAPVYIKKTLSGDIVKYYNDKRFILSAIVRDGAISAFLVFPKEGYAPNTTQHAGGEFTLSQVFSNIESVTDIRVNYSRSVSYYIESNPEGDFSNLYSSIAGYTEFEAPIESQQRELLDDISEALILGDDITEKVTAFRDKTLPNFYGYSTEGLDVLENAILTLTEYRLINQ